MRRGVHPVLEAEANRLLKESLRGVTRHSEKSDLLTPWKEAERHRREVYASSGSVDPAVRRGMYHRKANAARPELNSRMGVAQPRSLGSLSAFVQEHGFDDPESV